MDYLLSLTGKNASRMVCKSFYTSAEGLEIYREIEVTAKRSGDEDAVILESDNRASFEKYMLHACTYMLEDLIRESGDMFLTVGIFGAGANFPRSIVFSPEFIKYVSSLRLTLEINTYI